MYKKNKVKVKFYGFLGIKSHIELNLILHVI